MIVQLKMLFSAKCTA